LLGPSFDVFTRNSKFSTNINHWTVLLHQHSNCLYFFLHSVILIRPSSILFFNFRKIIIWIWRTTQWWLFLIWWLILVERRVFILE
jgi:hypothetical protein